MTKHILTAGIASVWLINGLFCKVLSLVPRHEMIVTRILGGAYAPLITKIIGILEILMAVWIISRIKARWCALFQIFMVAVMNILEFILARDLLLFGPINAVFAAFFIGVIVFNERVTARSASSAK